MTGGVEISDSESLKLCTFIARNGRLPSSIPIVNFMPVYKVLKCVGYLSQ